MAAEVWQRAALGDERGQPSRWKGPIFGCYFGHGADGWGAEAGARAPMGGEGRGCASAGAWVGCGMVKITIGFEHKHPQLTVSMGLHFLSPPSALTDGSGVRDKVGPTWVRKVFNYFPV